MHITDALSGFLTQLEADGRSPHTIGQYRRHIATLAHWMAQDGPRSPDLERLDHQAIARFLSSLLARTRPDGAAKKVTALNCLRSSVRTFFAYCHQAGYLPVNPGRLVRRANCSGGPPKAFSADEEERFLSTLAGGAGVGAERDHCLFHLMLASGIRLSAALGLDLEDLDLEAGEVTIRTKGNRAERVFLGKAIRDHLRRYVGARTAGPLFTSRDGRRVTGRHIQRRFREWLDRAGIRRALSPHSCRHRFALDLYRRTGDLLLVKAALHHRSIASTMVYAQADGERLRRAMA
jgi:site-specific recombinase XerC